ncbi:hypothetical protein O6H91_13G002400 [Diphasiastrum complanatum]|uniref:Uncharacterized protein n=1 Tax=Diphasiastrum complanatum TaxID=34168 RepID=A0ACC2BRT8_DIPCM|nr:hypothetical protein O6H91_13G002400 [Diphasiastrum complanatum]
MSALKTVSFVPALSRRKVWPYDKGKRGEVWSYNKGCCGFIFSTLFGRTFQPLALVPRGQLREDGPSVSIVHQIKASSREALEHQSISSFDRYTSEKSSIFVLGLSVHTAPIELREKLSLPEAEWPRAIEELCNQNHIEEAVVLSTCNRMEIYAVAVSWSLGVQEVTKWLSKISGIPIEELRAQLFTLQNRDAAQHLFRVASGLDSLVLGEGQILAQVKQVYKIGQKTVGFGKCLNELFMQAISTGKRVRSETSISAGAVSVSSAAVELAAMKFPKGNLSVARVLVVGAGKMSRLLVKHLVSKGCCKLVIVNRSEQKVVELQNEFTEAELVYQPLSELLRCAGEADVIFTTTTSESPLFFKKEVSSLKAALDAVGGRRLFIDISVPRNVSACVSEIPSVEVSNVDDLWEVVAANKEERKRKALEAQLIIEQELNKFEAWRDSLETVPTIKKLRAYAEKIRASELEKCVSKFGVISVKNRKLIDDLSRRIVSKLLHGPMQHLKTDATSARSITEIVENMHALERMFDLKTDDSTSLEQTVTKLSV